MNKTILLSAGGTGGHLFPAQALAQEMEARGWKAHLATDARGLQFAEYFAGDALHIVPAATFGSRNPIAIAKTVYKLGRGYWAARQLLKRLNASVAVGFGGYPSVPPLAAAQGLDLPTVLHEQNAVLGRANKLLARKATVVAAGFSSGSLPQETVITGNPLRPEILKIAAELDKADKPYQASSGNDPFNLLVIGGSQGAQFFGETVPQALALLSKDHRSRVRLTLQAREEQVTTAKTQLADAGVEADVAPFFKGMGDRLKNAHLMICRAGASTVSEIAAVGRPSILVPYPFALDHDQAANAAELVGRGGGIIAPQVELTAEVLAQHIASAMDEPDRLAKQAHAAAMTGKPDATKQLADLVEIVAKGRYVGGGLGYTPAEELKEHDQG